METGKPTQSLRKAFIEERKIHADTVIEEAQRLVNLYRHADAFGEDFMPKLDEMLLSAPSEVQTALSDILGGQVVRQYCTYLKERTAPKTTEQNSEESQPQPTQGYLPAPDEPVSSGASADMGKNVEALLKDFLATHEQELNELLKAQSDNLTTILGRFNQKAAENALYQNDRLINTIRENKNKEYADVIESGPQTPVLVPDETEGF